MKTQPNKLLILSLKSSFCPTISLLSEGTGVAIELVVKDTLPACIEFLESTDCCLAVLDIATDYTINMLELSRLYTVRNRSYLIMCTTHADTHRCFTTFGIPVFHPLEEVKPLIECMRMHFVRFREQGFRLVKPAALLPAQDPASHIDQLVKQTLSRSEMEVYIHWKNNLSIKESMGLRYRAYGTIRTQRNRITKKLEAVGLTKKEFLGRG